MKANMFKDYRAFKHYSFWNISFYGIYIQIMLAKYKDYENSLVLALQNGITHA